MYKNEDAIGEVIQEYIKAGKVKRQDLFIVTKVAGVFIIVGKDDSFFYFVSNSFMKPMIEEHQLVN
jgi:hypothetical protein